MTDTRSTTHDVTKAYGDGRRGGGRRPASTSRSSRGEFVVVAGPCGSGKTTLLQLLGALDRPTAGAVEFEGRDIAQMGDGELAALRRDRSGSSSSSST